MCGLGREQRQLLKGREVPGCPSDMSTRLLPQFVVHSRVQAHGSKRKKGRCRGQDGLLTPPKRIFRS